MEALKSGEDTRCISQVHAHSLHNSLHKET
jgi:hypothetical protein